MQLKEIMTPTVEVIAPEASIREAAEKMRHLDIGPLPVCDGDRLVGMLTDRDITVRAVAKGKDPKGMPVREITSREVVTIGPDDDLSDALKLMASYQVRRIPVVDAEDRLVGVV